MYAGSIASSIKLPTSGLIFYTDCASDASYPNSGTTWTDISPSKLTGTLSGATLPSFTASNGGYLNFNGTTAYVTYGNNLNPGTAAGWTVISWFYLNSIPTTNARYIVGKVVPGTIANGHYGLAVQPTTPRLQGIWRLAASQTIVSSSSALATGSWYMGTEVVNRVNGTINIYLNDTASAVGSGTFVAGTGSATNTATLIEGAGSGPTQYFPGRISFGVIYNRALTTTEIANIYNLTKNRYT